MSRRTVALVLASAALWLVPLYANGDGTRSGILAHNPVGVVLVATMLPDD